jgi:hypothetical protein
VSVTFFGYDEYPIVPHDGPIFLRTEKNHFVSLYNNVGSGSGDRSRNISGEWKAVVWANRISNLAVFGDTFWKPDDPIKQIGFRIDGAERVLLHRGGSGNLHTGLSGVSA